jgi:hypothetical protein
LGILYKTKVFLLGQEEIREIFVLAYTFEHALETINVEMSKQGFSEDQFEIMSINTKFNFVDAVNAEEESHPQWTGECECPYCAVDHAVLDHVMEFSCGCGHNLRVADNGWESVDCVNCGNTIRRTEVLRNELGKLIYRKGE